MTIALLFFITSFLIIYIGGNIMAAIDNLTQATLDLKTAVDALVVPTNNDVAIQAAADSINSSIAELKTKTGA